MRHYVSDAELERAIAEAGAFLNRQEGVTPHAVIEELIGLETYRRLMGCPDLEQIAAYSEDALSFEAALNMAAHEQRCPVCRADIVQMRAFVGQAVAKLFAGMPAWVTPFVGRDDLRRSLESALERDEFRCVTVSASSGMGKTRLMLETAVEQAHRFPDGVWYVPLEERHDPAQVASDIARAVQLPPEGKARPQEQLRGFFADRRALLMFDDTASTAPLASLIADLTSASPGLRCLTTAPRGLGFDRECVLPLPPMEAPRAASASSSRIPEALRLFEAHVRTFDSRFDCAAGAARAASEGICAYAAGVPLAIELAAARAREMSTGDILRSLEAETRAASPETSLSGLLDWSYGMLPKRHQRFLDRLSVFTGSFYIEQAVEICEDEEALRLIEHLHRNALVQRCEGAETARYQLLAPIRSFARARLGREEAHILRRHATCFLRYSQERAGTLESRAQIRAMEDLSADLPNLRAGMDWAIAEREWLDAGSYGLALNRFFFFRGDWQEASDRLRISVGAFESAEDESRRERAQLALAYALTTKGEYEEAEVLFYRISAAAADRGDVQTRAEACHGLGNIAQRRRRYAEAADRFTEALEGFHATGDDWRATDCRLNLGWVKSRQGEFIEAERLLKASLTVLRDRGDRYRVGEALSNLGYIACAQGRWDEARERFEACLQARQEVGFVTGVAAMINNLGDVWQSMGDMTRAGYCYKEAARRFDKLGLRRDLGLALANQGSLASAQGDTECARERFTEALRLWESVGDHHNMARLLGDIGRLADLEGNKKEALRRYQESLARLHALGIRAEVALALALCGQWAAANDMQESAALLLNVACRYGSEYRLSERAQWQEVYHRAEALLGEETAQVLRRQADAMSMDEAVARAIQI